MTDPSYNFALERARSGPPTQVDGWPGPVPNPAVLTVTRAPGGSFLVVTLEIVAGNVELNRLEVVLGHSREPITGSTLRSVKVTEVLRFAKRYLRRGIKNEFAPARLAEFSDQDILDAQKEWSEDDYLPRGVITREGLEPDPEWLAEIKALGPSNERVARTVATLYRLGVEAQRDSSETGGANAFVARWLALSRSTASNWIKVSREVGALEPATRKPRRKMSDA
jgi:hypothetical protein